MSPKGKKVDLNPARESLMNSLERIKGIVEKRAKEMTVCELQTRAEMVDVIFSQLNTVQAEIEQDGEQHERNTRQVYEELFFEVKSKIVGAINAHNRRSSALETSQSLNYTNASSSTAFARLANLPKINIPSFSGKYTEWMNWYSTFVSLIHNDGDLDNLSKYIHLRSALGPIPLRTIEALEITANNYEHALNLLKDRFENKAIIFQAHVKELFDIPKIPKQSPTSLRELIDNVNAHLRALRSLGSMEDVANVVIYYLIRSKIDPETLMKLEDCVKGDELPVWETLSKNLASRCITLERREVNSSTSNETPLKDRAKKTPVSLTVQREKQVCPSCSNSHTLVNCPSFLRLSVMQRYFEAKKHSLCLRCLVVNHSIQDCKAAQCSKCKGNHHSLLHREKKQKEKSNVVSDAQSLKEQPEKAINPPLSSMKASEESKNTNSLYNSSVVSDSMKFLATAVILVKSNSGKLVEGRAILDSGSQLNFITEEFVDQLNLVVRPTSAEISGIGSVATKSIGQVRTEIRSRLTNYFETLQFLVLPQITQYAPNVKINIEEWHLPKNIKLADPKFNESRSIDMLLGVASFFKLLSVGQITLGKNHPLLQKSLFGWILAGDYRYPSSNNETIISNSATGDQKLSQLVEKFWICETVDIMKPLLTPSEDECERLFQSGVRRTSSGRFIVSLPFKMNPPEIGESYSIALKRLESLERKLDRNPELKAEYTKFIDEYRTLGHLEKVPTSSHEAIKYFMPHHAVLRPESLSTKLRVVFDASCKSSSGFSLNDNLLVGPKIQPDLFDILINFRLFRYALTADISKMYRQIWIDENDCNWQGILWRDSKSKNVEVLRLKTVTYGTSSAPYLAVKCLQYLATNYRSAYPLGSKVLSTNFYMDDMLAGANSIEELQRLQKEISELLMLGKFPLHKWQVSAVGQDKVTTETGGGEPLKILSEDCSKTLGVLWYSTSDKFGFSYQPKFSSKITKRAVLSELAQLFDPLGLINPIIVLGKIFLQELWLLKLAWDESLPQNLSEQWSKYRQEWCQISELRFPRCVVDTATAVCVELHGFSDASNRAYGCALYSRTVDRTGAISVNLLTAKSRVSPLKSVSLPRLELQAAAMLAKFVDRVQRSCEGKFKGVYLWTDSTIVLNWISSHPSRWTTFVANRVAAIHGLTDSKSWHKIESKINPADIVSRGMRPSELKDNNLWKQGPPFLSLHSSNWPKVSSKEQVEAISEIEQRQNNFVLMAQSNPVEDIISTSRLANSFLKLNRVFGLINRWINRVRGRLAKKSIMASNFLTVQELRNGLNYIMFNVQQVSFALEIEALRKGAKLKSSRLQALTPFLDETGNVVLMRVGGRLAKADLDFFSKHPVILPFDHIFTKTLVSYLHIVNLHAGPFALLAFVRQRFWILNARKLVRRITRGCIQCFKYRPKAGEQQMGDLPRDRVVGSRHPFQKAGMDFAGPIMIHFKLRGKRPVKAYILLFVCFLTRACHIEVVSDLSTPAFLCALKRFFARRGLSSDLYCDNATNFVGAARMLSESAVQFFDEAAKNVIVESCSTRGVNFHFIPPRSPHMGGLWESAIKVAKSMLVQHINGASLTFEELTTVVAEIEGVMNSRPLYALSSDPNDLEALTPGHFLIGRPINGLPEPFMEEEVKVPIVNRWKRIQHIKLIFWKRWSKEYLLSLQQRVKWKQRCNNIQVGTLVLIAEDNVPPCKWLLGRIEEVFQGDDGMVRVVALRTKAGYLKRNIHKICPLPLGSED